VLLVTAGSTLSGCAVDPKAVMAKIGSLIQTVIQAVSGTFANLGGPPTRPGGAVGSATPAIGPGPGLTGGTTRPPASVIGGAAGQDDTTSLVIRDPDAPPGDEGKGGIGGTGATPGGSPALAGGGTMSGSASPKPGTGGSPSGGSSGANPDHPWTLDQIAGGGQGSHVTETGAGSSDGGGVGPGTTGAGAAQATGSGGGTAGVGPTEGAGSSGTEPAGGGGDEGSRIAALRAELEATYKIRLFDGEEMSAQPPGFSYKTIGRKTTFTLARLETLKKVLSGLPSAWIEALAFVRIKIFASLERVPSSGGTLLGSYIRAMNEVWLSDAADTGPGGYSSTLVHELTHVLAAKRPAILKGWRETFWGGAKQPPPPPRTPAPTAYGATCSDEDLAESVMSFVHDPGQLDPERRAFIEQYVFTK